MAEQQTQTEVANDTAVELQTAEEHTENKEPDDIQNNTAPSEKKNDNKVPVEMQLAMLKARPTVQDLFQKKVTWKEFLGVYNVLRIAIAAVFGVLIYLSTAAIAYLLNPNTCKRMRVKPNRIQYHPIAMGIISAWRVSLISIAMIRIFGHEILWSNKRVCRVILSIIVCVTVLFVLYAFLLNVEFIFYASIVLGTIAFVGCVYMFITNGFYLIWLMTPFIIVLILTGSIIFAFMAVFYYAEIGPESALFGFMYSFMVSVLESVALKLTVLSFPYKWGKCCTFPCNKGKFKSKLAKNYVEEKVTFEGELSDVIFFYYSMLLMSMFESLRVTGYVLTKDQKFGFDGLFSLMFFSAVFECISRNALMWEFVYRCILKKEAKDCPGRDRLYAIWYGTKFQGEYIPIWCILFMSLVNYGPFKNCGHVRDSELVESVNIQGYYWLFFVMFGAEFVSDIVSEVVLKIGRYFRWFGVKNEKGEDPPRKKTLVKVNLIPHMWILVHCYAVSHIAFQLDADMH